MQFYRALEFILNTSAGKARRSCWSDGYYISRGYVQECMSVIRVNGSNKSKFDREPYTAKPEDMTANDWEILSN